MPEIIYSYKLLGNHMSALNGGIITYMEAYL